MDPRDVPPPKQPVHEPYDLDMEIALLGSIIRDNGLIPQAMAVLDGQEFYDPMHGRIYEQITAWALEGERDISALSLSAAMKSDPGITEIGRGYFDAMRLAAPAAPNIRSFALTIRELSQRREALWAIDDAREALTTSPTQVRDALRAVIKVADEVERVASEAAYQSAYEAGQESIRDAERASAGQPVRAVTTGLERLDNELGRMQGGDFIVIAGKSGMGKSALMGGISWRAAMAGYPVLVISLEMKRKQWVQRIITDIDFDDPNITGPIHYRKFRSTGVSASGASLGFTSEEFSRIVLANQQLQDVPWLEIHEQDGLTMAQIAARARAFQAKWKNDPEIRRMQGTRPDEEPIGLIITDYLQIVDAASKQFRPREQEVRDIARGHKGLAKNLDWPVMAGSQINEDDKARAKDSKRPQAGDVRESKAIFHEADIMLAPYRLAQVLQDAKPDASPGEPAWNDWNGNLRLHRNHMDIIGLKNRMGRRFTLELFGEMAASAVRDQEPIRRVAQQEADDLLAGLKG